MGTGGYQRSSSGIAGGPLNHGSNPTSLQNSVKKRANVTLFVPAVIPRTGIEQAFLKDRPKFKSA
jgi:hypothetical protein